MNKNEFEKMVGKEVSMETFKYYEGIYMELPASVTKAEFIDLIDVESIPESEEAKARRTAAKEKGERKMKLIEHEDIEVLAKGKQVERTGFHVEKLEGRWTKVEDLWIYTVYTFRLFGDAESIARDKFFDPGYNETFENEGMEDYETKREWESAVAERKAKVEELKDALEEFFGIEKEESSFAMANIESEFYSIVAIQEA